MYGKQVYGIPLAGMSAVPAEQFLHSQSSMCACATCASIISAIFTIIIYQQYKNGMSEIAATSGKAAVPEQEQALEHFFSHIYLVGISQIFESCCIFSCVFGAAYYFVQNR